MLEQSLWRSAVELHADLDRLAYPHCFIGGVSLQRWGQPRMTEDLDLTVIVPFGQERQVAQRLLERYTSRHPSPLQFVLEARILLLEDSAGHQIDLSIGGLPFEQRMIDHATDWKVPGDGEIRTCSAEHLVVLKAFAARDQDWIDIQNVLHRQGERLDRTEILEQLAPLVELKEEPEILSRLQSLLK